MDKADNSSELWAPVRFCLRGAYGANAAEIPRLGDPKQLLDFLRFHIRERASIWSQPVHHVFTALVVASVEETDRGLVAHNFIDSLFIDANTEALENRGFALLRKLTA